MSEPTGMPGSIDPDTTTRGRTSSTRPATTAPRLATPSRAVAVSSTLRRTRSTRQAIR